MPPTIPPTAAGRQLAWMIDAIRRGTLDAGSLDARRTPEFIHAVPAVEIVRIGEQLAPLLDVLELGAVEATGDQSIEAEWCAADGSGLLFTLAVEPGEGRIAGLRVEPLSPGAETIALLDDLVPGAPRVSATSVRQGSELSAEIVDRAVAVLAEVATGSTVGVQAAIAMGDEIVSIDLGYASLEPQRPVTPATIFRAYSITKVVTATGLLLLAQDGAIDLDDPVNDHLRGYRVEHDDPSSPAVTFRHLLTHSSGASSSFEHWVEEVPPVESLLGPVLRCEFVPGTARTYSNGGFATIGKLIEDIGGEDLPGFMQRRVLRPLGMERSEYRTTNAIGDEWAVGHQIRRASVGAAAAAVPSVLGAGSLWSTATDLVTFGAAMASAASPLEEPFASAMFEPQGPPVNESIEQGLAWLLENEGAHRIAWHNGGGHGFSTTLAVAPGRGVAVAVLSNVGGQDPSPPTKQMLRVVLDAVV